MPVPHNNIICITPDELVKCGISAGYLKRSRSGQNKGEVYCWPFHKHGNTVYYHYHGLKPVYKNLVKAVICDGLEPEVWLKKQDELKKQEQLIHLTDRITRLVASDPDEIKHLAQTKLFTPTEVHQLARAAGWLRLINEFDVKKARKLGFENINDFRAEVFKRCLNEQTAKPTPLVKFKKGLITNENRFYKNALIYKREGIQALVHKGIGNANREKADTHVHAKLLELASKAVKYSWEDVSMMYNDWALEVEKPQMTTSAIKKYLNTPKIKKVWFYARHGKLAGDNELQTLISREKPSFPDALWSTDGTSMQLYYIDENGKIQSDLYVYFVTDAHTEAIIGYSIGYAETSGMVENALRMAVYRYGFKPYQLQYDNSSANISGAIQNLMGNMSRVHFPCEPYKGRAKYVESIIGHFQQRILRKMEEFKGGNITSKSLNSKANPELLAKYKKNPQLLKTLPELLAAFDSAINDWNSRGEKRDNYGRFVGLRKIEKYTAVVNPKRARLNYFDQISMFLVQQPKPYTYGPQGIEIEVGGKLHKFVVPDPDTVGDFIFANENMGEKFTVKMDREKPEMIALYKNGIFIDMAYNSEKYAACVADLKDGEKAKQQLFKQKQEDWGVNYSIRELEKQMSILDEIKATGTDGFGWWDMSKTAANKLESQLEDVKNGLADGLTERQRKILNIGK